MKSLIKFINDSLIIFCLFCIIAAAFMATYALSPVAYEKTELAMNMNRGSQGQDILGRSDFKYLEFVDTNTEHEYFSVNSSKINGNYKARIIVGPVSSGETEKPIVQVYNPSDRDQTVEIKLGLTQDLIDIIDVAVIINNKQYKMNADNNYTISINLKSEQRQDIILLLTIFQKVNYPINMELGVSSIS